MITTSTAYRRHAAGVLLALAVVVCGASWTLGQPLPAQSRAPLELFARLVDADGNPVTDLRPDEVLIQWDGKDCETLSVEPIRWPVRVTVFFDNGLGARGVLYQMRQGLERFVDEIPADVEIALLATAGQPRWITRHTTDRTELATGIGRIAEDNGTPARYLDALIEEAERLDAAEERYFPVIVMIATDAEDISTGQQQRYEKMMRQLLTNRATVHSRVYSRGVGGRYGVRQVGMSVQEIVGGTYQSLAVGSGFISQLPELARDIARKHRAVSNQYRVTYVPPDGASAQPTITTGVARQGIRMQVTLDGNIP